MLNEEIPRLVEEKIMRCEVCGFWEKVAPATIPDTAYKSAEMLLSTEKTGGGWGQTKTGYVCPDDFGKMKRRLARESTLPAKPR